MKNEADKLAPPTVEFVGRGRATLHDVLAEWCAVVRRVFRRPERLHYYAFSFAGGYGSVSTRSSVYVGWPDRRVGLARIDWAKGQAGVEPGAALLACSYLGRMTREEMKRGAA